MYLVIRIQYSDIFSVVLARVPVLLTKYSYLYPRSRNAIQEMLFMLFPTYREISRNNENTLWLPKLEQEPKTVPHSRNKILWYRFQALSTSNYHQLLYNNHTKIILIVKQNLIHNTFLQRNLNFWKVLREFALFGHRN